MKIKKIMLNTIILFAFMASLTYAANVLHVNTDTVFNGVSFLKQGGTLTAALNGGNQQATNFSNVSSTTGTFDNLGSVSGAGITWATSQDANNQALSNALLKNSIFTNNTNTQAFWGFDSITGIYAYDSKRNNDCTLNNMATGIDNGESGWTYSGWQGKALKFDGTDDFLNCGSDTSLDNPATLTITAWIKKAKDGVTEYIVSKRVGASTRYEFGITSANKLFLTIGNGTASKDVFSTTSITGTSWNHVAGIYNGTHMQTYINGIAAGTPVAQIGASSDAAATLFVGSQFGTTAYFNGTIDEVKVISRAITMQELQQDYLFGLELHDSNGESLPKTGGNSTGSINMSGNYLQGIGVKSCSYQMCRNIDIGCDGVCLDSDCSSEIQTAFNSVSSGGCVMFLGGEYPLTTLQTVSGINFKASIFIQNDNISVYGDGNVLFNASYLTVASYDDAIIWINASNITFHNIALKESNLVYRTSKSHSGIIIAGASDVEISNVHIDVNSQAGHAISINCGIMNSSKNVNILNSKLYGYQADTIGGGVNKANCIVEDTTISENYIVQKDSGAYNAFNMVKNRKLSFIDNEVYGYVVLGAEVLPHTFNIISRNQMSNASGNTQTVLQVTGSGNPATNTIISDNVIEFGYMDLNMKDSSAVGNTIYGLGSSAQILSNSNNSNNVYSDNTIVVDSSASGAGIREQGFGNMISDNNIRINNIASSGILVDGPGSHANSISHNTITGTFDNGIKLSSTLGMNKVDTNTINDSTLTSNNGIVVLNSDNTSISNNVIVGVDTNGIYISNSGSYNMTNRIYDNELYLNSATYGIRIISNVTAKIYDNLIFGSTTKYTLNGQSFVDDFEYTSMPSCITGNALDNEYITNSSDYMCRCDTGTWKCLGPFV